MSMNKFLMNIALCAISLVSVSYGAVDDVLRTPEKKGTGMSEPVTPSVLNSARSSVSGSPMRGGYQRFVITDSTTEGEVAEALIRAENEIFTSRKKVIEYIKALAGILTVDAKNPVKPNSETVKLTATELVSSIQSYKDAITKLEAEKKALEKRLRQWKYGVIVSGVVLAFIYQNVLNNGDAWLSFFINSWNSLLAK